MTSSNEVQICSTCAVENNTGANVCAICSDERQYIPRGGQQWTSLKQMREDGYRVEMNLLEPNLFGITSVPAAGIGQQSKLLCTPGGNLLWDPIGYVDDAAVERVRKLGEVRAIVASHPHMYGVQVAWSHALGNVPILIAEADQQWVARQDPAIEVWSADTELMPGVTLHKLGGHFPGSSVVHWADGSDGKGVLLSSDTIFANPDRTSVSFMRSYPNRLPLSGAVVARIAASVNRLAFDRLYGNFDTVIDSNARRIIQVSADRHIAWINGEFDELT